MQSFPAEAKIHARACWNDTGIYLSAGVEYTFSATGEWADACIHCGPNGYESPNFYMRAAEKWRRAPDQKWFALIGTIDHNPPEFFLIGKSTKKKITRNGVLCCFANDVPFFYWNNSGLLKLTVSL
jgi:hypothetical protein